MKNHQEIKYEFGKEYVIKKRLTKNYSYHNKIRSQFWEEEEVKPAKALCIGHRTLRNIDYEMDFNDGWLPIKITKTYKVAMFITKNNDPFYVKNEV